MEKEHLHALLRIHRLKWRLVTGMLGLPLHGSNIARIIRCYVSGMEWDQETEAAIESLIARGLAEVSRDLDGTTWYRLASWITDAAWQEQTEMKRHDDGHSDRTS